MPPIISQLVKFATKPGFTLASSAFVELRKAVVERGVKEQYYGLCTDAPNTLFWVIQWPMPKGPQESSEFKDAIKALDVHGAPEITYLPFAHDSLPRPALTAPVCELCFVHVKDNLDKSSPWLAHSLEKTFTDCYLVEGFVGGAWSTAKDDDRLNYYYLGWQSRALHAAYTRTELFAEELDKLRPHMDGTAAFMRMTQELN
ncbi:hypothetical protein C8F01DRAFT_440409 [Mycena amicta]|nr:hypothetical protein C8F01DRAFT_440409 [Mycena amicta]